MNHDIYNAAAALVLAGSAFYLGTLFSMQTTEDAVGTGCRRRGCRRMPAGQGCDHRPPADGSAERHFQQED